MAFADWLLPLMLLVPDDAHEHLPFDWAAFETPLTVLTDPAP